MRVIAEKKDNPEIPRMNVSCTGNGFLRSDGKGCGRLLEITPMDVKSGVTHDYDGGTDTYYYIRCPVCSHKTEVYYSQMSTAFRSLV